MADGRPDRSFPKARRIVSSDDYRLAYRSRHRGKVGAFAWHARPNVYGYPRLGLSVPKKVVKRATDRSRVKRVIRDSFRHNQGRLPTADIIISVRALPDDLHQPSLHAEVGRIWEAVLSSVGKMP